MAEKQNPVKKAYKIDVNKLKFSPPKKTTESGGKTIYINNEDSMLYVQSPKANILWDSKFYVSDKEHKKDYKPDNNNKEHSGNYKVEFSFTDMVNNKDMKDFYDMLVDMDTRIVDHAYKNRKEWFGAQFHKTTKDTIESLYTSMIKVSIDQETGEPSGRFPPRFRFKVTKWENKHSCKVYENKHNELNIDDDKGDNYKSLGKDILVKGTTINVALKCNGIWVINGKFGCTWRAEQIKVKLPEQSINGYAFDDDDDDMDVVDSNEQVGEVESDSDNDDSDDDESDDSDGDSSGGDGDGGDGGDDGDGDDTQPVNKSKKRGSVKKQ